MKNSVLRWLTVILLAAVLSGCVSTNNVATGLIPDYTPDDAGLYAKIVALDKQFFRAYNDCDIGTMDRLISEDLEFYHDTGGMLNSKQALMTGLKNNVCGEGKKVRRELLPNTTEVYRIPNYGAVQISIHRFHNEVEGSSGRPGRVVNIWREEKGSWRLTRVVSLH